MVEKIFSLFSILFGVACVVFRRQLVRWHHALFWSSRPLSESGARAQEILQLMIGVFLILFGLFYLIFRS